MWFLSVEGDTGTHCKQEGLRHATETQHDQFNNVARHDQSRVNNLTRHDQFNNLTRHDQAAKLELEHPPQSAQTHWPAPTMAAA